MNTSANPAAAEGDESAYHTRSLLARDGSADRAMLSRVLPDDGLSRLDVAAFQASI
ncbi:hypothetical protein ABUW04_33415 [Streptacidiphilus sp. N1-10]|uniref:FXSXX-COOH protein n=1 Tax=Streptacidiphilus jeojiensis TaxID=3229225 RepID=A0ABV6XYH0_9ACTN